MSGGMKAFLIVVAILGTCMLLCCCGFGFIAYSFAPKDSKDPAQINAARDAIAKINLPAGFEPVQMIGIDNFMMLRTDVVYENPAVHGSITLAEMNVKIGGPQQRQNLEQMLLQSAQQDQRKNTPLINEKSSTKTIKIKEHNCVFEFREGQDSATKSKHHQISGVFDGRHGPVCVSIEIDDSAYHEDVIVKTLETIQ